MILPWPWHLTFNIRMHEQSKSWRTVQLSLTSSQTTLSKNIQAQNAGASQRSAAFPCIWANMMTCVFSFKWHCDYEYRLYRALVAYWTSLTFTLRRRHRNYSCICFLLQNRLTKCWSPISLSSAPDYMYHICSGVNMPNQSLCRILVTAAYQ